MYRAILNVTIFLCLFSRHPNCPLYNMDVDKYKVKHSLYNNEMLEQSDLYIFKCSLEYLKLKMPGD